MQHLAKQLKMGVSQDEKNYHNCYDMCIDMHKIIGGVKI